MSVPVTATLVLALVINSFAATLFRPQDGVVITELVTPKSTNNSTNNIATAPTSADNMIYDIVASLENKPIKSIADLKQALTTSVKSQIMTSLANSPSTSGAMASLTEPGTLPLGLNDLTMGLTDLTTGGAAVDPNQFAQLNLMGGINDLVNLIVQKILQSLLPNIFSTPVNTPPMGAYPGYNPGFGRPNNNAGGGGGLFGGLMGMMNNPMGMMMPAMTFNFMDNMLEGFI